jgi:hypothetical protein
MTRGNPRYWTACYWNEMSLYNSCSSSYIAKPTWEPTGTPSSLCALNACALRYLAAGFRSTSKAAHLVQGTQVSSDAGHNDVHCCPAPAEVRKYRYLLREKGMAEAWKKWNRIWMYYNLKERLKEWPVKACLELLVTSPVTTTRVVAIASMPSVTEVIPYSRRTVGICR